MRQFDALQATAATAATSATLSNVAPATASVPTGGASFGAAYRQLQNDVNDFIAHGGGGFSTPSTADVQAAYGSAAALNAEGWAARQRAGASAVIFGNEEGSGSEAQQQFLASIQPWAAETAEKLGVAPELVAAHAALESGWGQRPLRNAASADTNNLFGIKASGGWQGAVAAATTTEYQQGVALKKVERFRSYPDAASAFRDYADILTSNPRYAAALNTGSDARAFARGLAQGGYATDPTYADKLSKLAARLQRSAAIQGD
ncbi:glucosaminidase domain-containing protein [Oxalobacteraceae bacterium A2-2]